jgi:hypothetical protein
VEGVTRPPSEPIGSSHSRLRARWAAATATETRRGRGHALTAAVDTLAWLTEELEHKGVTITKLRKLLFGSSSEKTKDVLVGVSSGAKDLAEQEGGSFDAADGGSNAREDRTNGTSSGDDEKKPGRTQRRRRIHRGRACGGLARHARPQGPVSEVRQGQALPQAPEGARTGAGVGPLNASRYELERLRCNLCGATFVAEAPPGVGESKYDETAAALIALLKYGCGLPFN